MSPIVAGGRLGRYQILRMLGAGAMGEVFLAEDPQIGRQVAIKTVRVEEGRPNEMEERKRRLIREARAAGKLLHPNVVALFDVGEDAGVLYLAFECVEGSDLAQRLEVDPPVTLREAITYVRQAAEGLDYAHRQGVVHRDIKPSNLLISSAGTVKVSDFGIAKLKDQTSDLTMTGSVVGSPHYLSPEQIRGDELDGRSDIFSLGVLFYEVLSRRRPFEGETLTTLVYQILHRDPPSIVVDRPELGTRLEGVLQRMLQKERDDRYATAGEVARDLAICEQEIPASILDSPAAKDAGAPTASTRRMSTSERAVQMAPQAGGAQAAPPPPPPPAPLSMTQEPTAKMPARQAAVGAAAAAKGSASPPSRTGLAIVAVVVTLVVAALVLGGIATRRYWAAHPAKQELQPSAAATSPASTDGKADSTSRPPAATTPETGTSTTPVVPLAVPPATDNGAPDAGDRFHQATREPATASPTNDNPATPASQPGNDVEPTRPIQKAPVHVPPPVKPEPQAEPVTEPAKNEDADEPSPPIIDRPGIAPRIDRMMVTGMSLSFVVEPPEAIVKVDGIVIGQAGTWNAKKRDGRAYDLPDSGDHIVRITHEGRITTIRVSASAEAPSPTLVSVDLRAVTERAKRPRRAGDRN
ncbi:MAG: serine/threonine-protein kinase [Thermoanaerobaculia bacterium]